MAKRIVICSVVAIMIITSCIFVGCGSMNKDYIEIRDYFDYDVQLRVASMKFKNISQDAMNYLSFKQVNNEKLYNKLVTRSLNLKSEVNKVGNAIFIMTQTGQRERFFGFYNAEYIFNESARIEGSSDYVFMPYRYLSEPQLIIDNHFSINQDQFIQIDISEQEMVDLFASHPQINIKQVIGDYIVRETIITNGYENVMEYALIFKTENDKQYMNYDYSKYAVDK